MGRQCGSREARPSIRQLENSLKAHAAGGEQSAARWGLAFPSTDEGLGSLPCRGDPGRGFLSLLAAHLAGVRTIVTSCIVDVACLVCIDRFTIDTP